MTLHHQIRYRFTRLAVPLIAFAMIAGVTLALNALNPPWQNWSPSGCFPNCFCEAVRPGFVRQPANTYSNLAYILIGLVVAGTARPAAPSTPTRNRLQSHPGYPRLYGWAVFAIGAGSLFYHASLTYIGQFFDWLGMYAFVTFIIVYNVFRFVPGRGVLFGLTYGAMLIGLGGSFFFTAGLRTQIYTYLLYLSIGLEVFVLLFKRPRVNFLLYLAALACLVAARIIWGWDLDGTICDPHSLWQGHALWHILTALATAFLFRYYLSEQPRS